MPHSQIRADTLMHTLRKVRSRLLAVRAAEAGMAGALVGAAAALAITALRILTPRALPLGWDHPVWPLVGLPAGFAVAFLVRLAAGVSLRRAAIAADRAAQLKERFATALEVLSAAVRVDAVPARPGDLDEALLEQAREEASRLDVSGLRLARSLGRRARLVLVAAVVLAGLAFVPSLAGPPLAEASASRAAETLHQAGRDARLAPDLRRAVEGAISRLLEPGARERDAQEATQAVQRAALDEARRRDRVRDAISKVPDPAVGRMAASAGRGDAPGAADAADELARRLASPSGAGGLPNVERRRLADSLEGAARAAQEADLARLAEELRAAAQAIRDADARTPQTLERLAEAMTEALGTEPAEAADSVLAAVRQARRTLGLADAPAGTAAAPVADTGVRESPTPPAAAPPETSGEPSGTAVGGPVPPEVRPEDRDAVRRYFGG